MKTSTLLIALFVSCQCLSSVARASATFLVETPQGATVFSVDTLATPASALLKLGECQWVLKPSADLSGRFEELARQRSAVSVPCRNFGRDANRDPNIYETAEAKSCGIYADDARPIAFAGRVASSGHGAPCDVRPVAALDEAIDVLGKLGEGADAYCYGFYWLPGVQAATVRLSAAPRCSRAQHPVGAIPGTFNVIAESHSGGEVIFRFATQDGQSWQLTSIGTGGIPSAYLTRWADSIEKVVGSGLTLPRDDPLHARPSEPRDAVFLAVRWSLALALSSKDDSDLGNKLREWMGGIALINQQTGSADTAYRSECDVAASPPDGCSMP